ncbi:MAG: TetR/AcrR family transcriptional regulator [Halodesulfovibrio sp.]
MGRKKSTENDTMATRERILETAEQLFKQVGYAKTTVADIADSLGMSPANIYRFFSTKGQINEEVCDRLVRSIEERCRQSVQDGGGSLERIRGFILSYYRLIRATLLKGDKLYDMIPIAMEQKWPIIHDHSERMRSVLLALVEQGIAAGEIRQMDGYTLARALHQSITTFIYPPLLARWVSNNADAEQRGNVEEQLGFLLDLLFEGMVSSRG